MSDTSNETRLRDNLQAEVDGARLYRALAEAEPNPDIAKVYARLASIEEAHAEVWRKQLQALGKSIRMPPPGWRTRALSFLARRFGPAFVLPVIGGMERIDSSKYDTQAEAVAGGLPQAERSHARILQAIGQGLPNGMQGSALARLEGRHRSGGNALRAAVLGANDGLVSNLSLVAGVAGATIDNHTLLLTGIAGLVAGACSMAMGEWLSVNSARELYQGQIQTEAMELEQAPEEEQEELALIYQAKGLPQAEAQRLAAQMIANRATALDTLVREELGIDPDDLGGSAWTAAATSFALFAIGALFPLVGFTVYTGMTAVQVGFAASALALFAIGAGTSLFTGRGLLFSGMRQLTIGLGSAAITYGIGWLIGVSLVG